MKNKKILLYILLIFSFLLVISSIKAITSLKKDQEMAQKLNEKLKEQSKVEEANNIPNNLINPPKDGEDSYWNYVDTEFLNVDFASILEQNNDTVAWIQVPGTKIDYPVVQTTDNKFYLSHSFDKSESLSGWVFSDYRNNLNNPNYNSIIYGHRSSNDAMFGSLPNILQDQWHNDYKNYVIKLSTPRENTIWQIFSVYTIYMESYYITTNFRTLSLYQEFLDTILNRSIYDFKTKIDTNDRILTLSTCRDSYGNRLVVHAKLIKKGIRSN